MLIRVNMVLSNHARAACIERGIVFEWIERSLGNSVSIQRDSISSSLLHALISVPERDGRVLRVIYNPDVHPVRIVTVFFDR